MEVVRPIVEDPNLTAMDKFTRLFSTIAAWKTDRMDLLLTLLRAWYTDDNALFRQKTIAANLSQFNPMLAVIIRQGVEEGVFSTPYPNQIGEVLLSLFQGMGDSVAAEFLAINQNQTQAERMENFHRVEQAIGAHTSALERVLGAREGSLTLVEVDTLKAWLIPQGDFIRTNV
jgi:hypothetical protein